jgi:hypothetical protein
VREQERDTHRASRPWLTCWLRKLKNRVLFTTRSGVTNKNLKFVSLAKAAHEEMNVCERSGPVLEKPTGVLTLQHL